MLKCKRMLFLGFIVCTLKVSGQELSVEKAYRQSSVNLLQDFVQSFSPAGHFISADDTATKVNLLLNEFVRNYYFDSSYVNSGAFKLPKGKQKQYVILQPQVEICFADRTEIESVFGPNRSERRENFDMPLYRHHNVYRGFPSGSYYIFKKLSNCRLQSFSLDIEINSNYKTIVADTSLIHSVNRFLHQEPSEYASKVKFLTPTLALYPGVQVQTKRKDGTLEMRFDFSLYIERIVMDLKMECAFIQYAFKGGSLEAYYRLQGGKWEEVENGFVMQL